MTYPYHEWVRHADYMRDVPAKGSKWDAFITKSGRCGAPLDLKKVHQLAPVAAIARALNSKKY
jgi:hypothetical protein